VAADALSRVAHLMNLQAVSSVQLAWIQEVINSYVTDAQAQQMLAKLAILSPDAQGYSLDRGLSRHNDKVWIGNNAALRTKIIAAYHSSALGGHSGIAATYHRIKRHFAWKGMKQDVKSFYQAVFYLPTVQTLKYSPLRLATATAYTGGGMERFVNGFYRRLA